MHLLTYLGCFDEEPSYRLWLHAQGDSDGIVTGQSVWFGCLALLRHTGHCIQPSIVEREGQVTQDASGCRVKYHGQSSIVDKGIHVKNGINV